MQWAYHVILPLLGFPKVWDPQIIQTLKHWIYMDKLYYQPIRFVSVFGPPKRYPPVVKHGNGKKTHFPIET